MEFGRATKVLVCGESTELCRMDSLDIVAVYGLFGGAVAGFVNWAVKREQHLDMKTNLKYYALFASMGCLSAAVCSAMLPQTATTGFVGGFIGSFVLLGAGKWV